MTSVYPQKTMKTVEVGPFRLNLVRMAIYQYEVPTRGPLADGEPAGWKVDLWRGWDLVQGTEFPDEAMAQAVFDHLAEGLPVRLARIAHRLDR